MQWIITGINRQTMTVISEYAASSKAACFATVAHLNAVVDGLIKWECFGSV
jgi:hypothetical protein